MAKMKVKIKPSVIRAALLKSEETEALCKELADGICQRCGEGYKTDVYRGANRVNAMVYADTYPAKLDNTKNNTLLKAMGR